MHFSTLSAALMVGLTVASPIAMPDYVVDWTIETVVVTLTAGQPTPSAIAAEMAQADAFDPASPTTTTAAAAVVTPAPVASDVPIQSVQPAQFFEEPVASSSPPSAPASSPTAPSSSAPSGINNGVDVAAVMTKHNDYRHQHGADPLSWDQTLADSALQHAQKCVFAHNTPDERSAGNYGQNMFASTEQAAEAIGTTVDSWYSESSTYPFNSPPSDMAEGWGHFSQLVWKSSTKVGCANFYCNSMTDENGQAAVGLHSFVVCNYQTPGNVQGAFSQNVS